MNKIVTALTSTINVLAELILRPVRSAGYRSRTRKFSSTILPRVAACVVAGSLVLPVSDTRAQSTTDAYQFNTGDKLKVTVFGHSDLSGEFEVDPAGNIILPLIKDVVAKGVSPAELEAAITSKLSPDYLKNPKVSVEVLTYRPIYVLGEVERPGSYAYSNGMTVIESVALAGGFTYRARKKKITVTRGASNEKKKIKVDANTPILPGDVIQIPERRF